MILDAIKKVQIGISRNPKVLCSSKNQMINP